MVVDDGYVSVEKASLAPKIDYQSMPFDSGLSAKRNVGLKKCQTKYLLLGCDDFDFGTPEAKTGILKLIEMLDTYQVDVASGRVNNYTYEGFIEYKPGDYFRQYFPKDKHDGPPAQIGGAILCDITINYYLIRIDSMRNMLWDEKMKIGGEHGEWFLSLKEADKKVVWVPGVNITSLDLGKTPNVQDPAYDQYRDRAISLGHRLFKEKRNIKTFITFTGGII